MTGSSTKRWLALVVISILPLSLSFVVFIDFAIINTILRGTQRDLGTLRQ